MGRNMVLGKVFSKVKVKDSCRDGTNCTKIYRPKMDNFEDSTKCFIYNRLVK